MLQLASPTALFSALLFLSASLPAAQAQQNQETEGEAVFANPQLLLSTEWLAQHGSDEGLRIVDVRPAQDFRRGHLPGARSLPTSLTYAPQQRGKIGSPEQIAALLAERGITNSNHVLIYDAGRTPSAARVFWTLEVYGHAKVSVLDGGFAKWKHEDRTLTEKAPSLTAARYELAPQRAALSGFEQLMDDLHDPEVVMLDSRSSGEFKAGRIPAAVHIEWLLNYTTGDLPVFKGPAELRQLYAARGIDSAKRVHAY